MIFVHSTNSSCIFVLKCAEKTDDEGIYLHYLISEVPGVSSRAGKFYTFKHNIGQEFLAYKRPVIPRNNSTKIIVGLYQQHEWRGYFAAHRFRRKKTFHEMIGNLLSCSVVTVVSS